METLYVQLFDVSKLTFLLIVMMEFNYVIFTIFLSLVPRFLRKVFIKYSVL